MHFWSFSSKRSRIGKISRIQRHSRLAASSRLLALSPELITTPHVQDKAQMKDTTASLIGPLKVEKDAVINGVSASGHSHDVTGVQSGNSTITSKQPNPG